MWQSEVVPQLVADTEGRLQALTLFTELCRRHLGRFQHRVLLSRQPRLPQQATHRVPQQADVRRIVHVRLDDERVTPPA